MSRTVNLAPLNSARNHLRNCLSFVADAVWPRRCHLCEAPGAMGLDLCATCAGDLPWMPDACPRCALPHAPGQVVCACELLPSWLDGVFAAFLYMAPLDAWLPRLKFHGDLALGDLMASLMAEGLASAPRPSCLIPVPLHTPRLRARGYNQAVELARPLAVQMGLPLQSRLLRRRKQTLAQSELGLEARMANMADAFEVRAGASLPRHVALVDDVMTTGATLQEAAWTLKDAGVARVDAWVCARVP